MSYTPEPMLVLREHLPLPQPYTAPRTDDEAVLAEIWRTALSMDCVGVHDSYLDLGGDSFLGAVIFSMIETAFGVKIPMAILVSSPTVAELAARIGAFKEAG
jgi:acyl carrier protein